MSAEGAHSADSASSEFGLSRLCLGAMSPRPAAAILWSLSFVGVLITFTRQRPGEDGDRTQDRQTEADTAHLLQQATSTRGTTHMLTVASALTRNKAPGGRPQRLLRPDCVVGSYGGRADGYGAWTLCSELLSASTTIVSVGIGSDVSFDLALAHNHGATVHCFDPTIDRQHFERIVAQKMPSPEVRARLTFWPFGLGGTNDVINFYRSKDRRIASLVSTPGVTGYEPKSFLRAPILRMQSLLGLILPHHPEVVKMDIEGAEWALFNQSDVEMRTWLARTSVNQLAIEFHDRFLGRGTRRGAARHHVVQLLQRCGFVKRHTSNNGQEVLFVRIRAVLAC